MKLFNLFAPKFAAMFFEPDGDPGGTPGTPGTPGTSGTPGTPGAGGSSDPANGEKTFSQADVDRIVTERIARERKKLPNIDELKELKEKAQKWDQQEAASLSEIDKLKKACEAATTARLEAEARAKAADVKAIKTLLIQKAGIPMDLIDRVRGETEEEIKADIEVLKPLLSTTTKKGAGGIAPLGSDPKSGDPDKAGAFGADLAKKYTNKVPKTNFFAR